MTNFSKKYYEFFLILSIIMIIISIYFIISIGCYSDNQTIIIDNAYFAVDYEELAGMQILGFEAIKSNENAYYKKINDIQKQVRLGELEGLEEGLEEILEYNSLNINKKAYNIDNVFLGEEVRLITFTENYNNALQIFINLDSKESVEKLLNVKVNEYIELTNPEIKRDGKTLRIIYNDVTIHDVNSNPNIKKAKEASRTRKTTWNILMFISMISAIVFLCNVVIIENNYTYFFKD